MKCIVFLGDFLPTALCSMETENIFSPNAPFLLVLTDVFHSKDHYFRKRKKIEKMQFLDLKNIRMEEICMLDTCFKCRLYSEAEGWSAPAKALCGLVLELPGCCGEHSAEASAFTEVEVKYPIGKLLLTSFAMTSLFAICYVVVYFLVIKKLRKLSKNREFKFSPLSNRRQNEILNIS